LELLQVKEKALIEQRYPRSLSSAQRGTNQYSLDRDRDVGATTGFVLMWESEDQG